MKKKPALVLLLLVIVSAGAAVWHGWLSPALSLEQNDTPLTLHGNVDIREVNLGFRVSGRVAEVLHDEGDAITAGEMLARLDAGPYRHEVDQARASLAAAESDAQRLAAGYRPEEIDQARASVEQAEVVNANAKLNANRARDLITKNVIPQEEHDDRLAREAETDKQLQAARANLALLAAGYRAEDIAKARAQVAQARAVLATAQLNLDDTTLAAPSSGTLVTRALEPGSIVQPGVTVLTLSLDRPVWVRAYVDERDLGLVAPGTEVDVFTDSRQGKPYRGKIGFVSPRAEFTPKTVETENLRTSLVYRLRIVVAEPDSLLRQGMPVTVRVKKPL
ncbi:secretion protein HlyD [Opitutaceae bacterium TAV4]|nr:secretion protein HlyD [Opitutaceae bacterium TAV4]RRJ98028.1 secretion protein HlyD [Opitutaceae bacterium TAV4]RRK02563.1 secretion protein HlyD [Opitutaceae bacterium TAV3]